MPARQTEPLDYRADIDGLRGLAILLVVFWHYGIAGVPGGFVGVDIFFVISGYLIASIIAGQMERGHFSLTRFFEARLRRLAPALFLVLAVSFVAAALILFPVDFDYFARSAAATALFVSNFLFAREAGSYFDIASQFKPLLHSWSLGVEGQFYLLFPFLMLGAGRFRAAVMGLLAAASLGLSIWQVQHAPPAAFYLIPSRAWELLLGALLASAGQNGKIGPVARDAVAAASLLAILAAAFFYRETMPFPGTAALVPCLAIAALIRSGTGGKSLVHRGLAAWPLNRLGLISYSLYLWHWPVLVFARYLSAGGLSIFERGILILLCLALACLSWRYVELPFRRPRKLLSRRNFLLASGAMAILVVAFAFLTVRFQGWPERYNAQIAAIVAAPFEQGELLADCSNSSAAKMQARHLCRFGADAARPDTIVWGDSHAFFLMPALSAALAARGRAAILVEHPGCIPLFGVGRPDEPLCAVANDTVRQMIRDPSIRTVVLDARWAEYLWLPPHESSLSLKGIPAGTISNNVIFDRQLEPTVRELAGMGKEVILVGSVPEIGWDVPRALARTAEFGIPMPPATTLAEFQARQVPVEDAFRRMREKYGVPTPEPSDRLCGPQTCKVEVDGKPLYRDEDHLTVAGALYLAPLFTQLF